jgi:putative alpha-1,2-mannosidase
MRRIALVIAIATLTRSLLAQTIDYARYVNPLIGTERMGHTFPGATVPFGAVQLSPDTDEQPHNIGGKYNPETYRYCAGYQYEDKEIVGFSHTHFSGTGHSDLGDFLIMPTVGPLQLEPGTKDDPKSGFRSAFSHATEIAQADYYKVRLDDDDILAEMTTATRVGLHQYTFEKGGDAHIILDLMHGIYEYEGKNVWTYARVVDDHTVVGFRSTDGWARTRTEYFAMEFSRPFEHYGYKEFAKQPYQGFWRKFDQYHDFPEMAGKQLRAWFDFGRIGPGEKVQIKFALSPVSTDGAIANLRSEIRDWDFERVRSEGRAAWNKELSRIGVSMDSRDDMVSFYTSMYHAMITPTVYMDVDGQYKGVDQNVHQALQNLSPRQAPTRHVMRNDQPMDVIDRNHISTRFTNYTTYSLWDTFRTFHPLMNIIEPSRNRDMIRSMMAVHDQSPEHMLPVWETYGNETWCMIGYHSAAVIADAIVTGNLAGAEANKALDDAVETAHTGYYDGISWYEKLGYVPEDKNSTSVSKTLEYAYDDWAIAQAAKKLGRTDVYNEFIKRSENWRNVWDPSVRFMRPKDSSGKFLPNFDPQKTEGQGFIEGNAWNYSLFVPHDPDALATAMGGKAKLEKYLDELFTMHLPDSFFATTEDITRDGIIGGYIHGNEPAHHVAYLYDWTDSPWKTQSRVRGILRQQYKATPDGLGGNDDCGQMSAWYILSSLGFYPVAPASARYMLGSPSIKTAALRLENGRTFTIEARDQSETNVYVSRVTLNGRDLGRNFITYGDIMGGGKLVFYMSNKHA